jgi:hypothetical protein
VRISALYLALGTDSYSAYLYDLPTPKLLLGRTVSGHVLLPALTALEQVFGLLEDMALEIYIASRDVFFALRDLLDTEIHDKIESVFQIASNRLLRLSLHQVNVIQPHQRFEFAQEHLPEALALKATSQRISDVALFVETDPNQAD